MSTSTPPALLIIDMQRAIDHPSWGTRNNPPAEHRLQALLQHWREQAYPVIHIRHDSREEGSYYRPGQPWHAFKAGFSPLDDETVFAKQVNNAFIGTELDDWLRERDIDTLVVGGVITNNSVEATVRMAGNLGFSVFLAADGCYTFDKTDLSGRHWGAEDVHQLSLANLDGEYCTVSDSDSLLAMFL